MRQQLRLRVILPVAVLALLGAGVGAYATGGGGDDSSDFVVTHKANPKAAKTVAPAVWARKADALCRRTERQYEAIAPRTHFDLEPSLVKAVAISAKADDELAALGVPRGRKALATQLLNTSRAGTAAGRDWLAALRRGDGRAFRAIARKLDRLDVRFERLAGRLGVRGCTVDASGGIEATPKQNAAALLRHPARALNLGLVLYRTVVVVFYRPKSQVDAAAIHEARAAAVETHAGFLPVNARRNGALTQLAEKYDVHASPAVLVFTKGPKVAAKFDGFVDRETVAQAVTDARR